MQYLTNSKMPDYVLDKNNGSGTGVCKGEHNHPLAAWGRRKTHLTVLVHLEAGNRMKGGKGHSQAYKVGFKQLFKNRKGRWHRSCLGG